MADPKVEFQVDKDGNASIGVTHDGVFIPYATVDAVTLADRVAAGQSPEAQAAAGSSAAEGEASAEGGA